MSTERSVAGYTMAHIGARLERVMLAAISAMSKGSKAPHCWSAHVIGEGYVNRGDNPETRADYLRQLEREARSEWENCKFAVRYVEGQGETQPRHGIVALDWNVFPEEFGDLLEKMGYDTQWNDEWGVCNGCQGMIRTEADGWDWKPGYKIVGGDFLCLECAGDEDEDEA